MNRPHVAQAPELRDCYPPELRCGVAFALYRIGLEFQICFAMPTISPAMRARRELIAEKIEGAR